MLCHKIKYILYFIAASLLTDNTETDPFSFVCHCVLGK